MVIMKTHSLKNFLIGSLLTLSLAAVASSSILNLWVNNDRTGQSYIDRLYQDGKVEISATKNKSSTIKDAIKISVTLTKRMGSRSQKKYYIGETLNKAALPVNIDLKTANSRGRITRNRIKGQLILENGDKDGIQGTLFGEKIDAISTPIF